MKGKSILVQMLSLIIALSSSFKGIVSIALSAWFGIGGSVATVILSTFFPSGQLVAGWNTGMWILNGLLVVNQLMNIFSSGGLLPVDIANYVTIAINMIIQVFLKDYTGTGSIAEKKLV